MKNYQKKNNFMRFLETWPMLGILAIFALFIAWGVMGLYGGLRDTIKNKRVAEAKVQELTDRKERLTNDISNLETDAGKEKIFRENFGLAKEGEEVIQVIDDKNQPLPEKSKTKTGFFGFFKNWFK